MNLPDVVQRFIGDASSYVRSIDEMTDAAKSFAGSNRAFMKGIGQDFGETIAALEAKLQEYRATMAGVTARTNSDLELSTKYYKKLTFEIDLAKSAADRWNAAENARLKRGSGFERGASGAEMGLIPGRRDAILAEESAAKAKAKIVTDSLAAQKKAALEREEAEQKADRRQALGFGRLLKDQKEYAERIKNLRSGIYGTAEDRLRARERRMGVGFGTAQRNAERQRRSQERAANRAQKQREQQEKDAAKARKARRSAMRSRTRGQLRGFASQFSPINTNNLAGMVTAITGAGVALWGMKQALDAVHDSISSVVSNAMEMERMTVTFGVLLGSAQRGKEVFGEIQQMAIVTPFTTEQLANTAQTLLGMGVAGDDLIGVLDRIGDLAVGDSDRLRRLGIIYGQVMAEGRLTGQRMRQFATLGIGMKDFADTMGVSVNTARAQMRSFGLDTDVVAATINRLTEAGGRFAGLNAANLGTVAGQWNRITDVIQIGMGKIGLALFERFDIAGVIGSISDSIAAAMPKIQQMFLVLGEIGGQVFREISNVAIAAFRALGSLIPSLDSGMGGLTGTIRVMSDAMIHFGKIGIEVVIGLMKVFIEMALRTAEFVGSLERAGVIAKSAVGGAIAGAVIGAFGGPIGIAGGAIVGGIGGYMGTMGMEGLSPEQSKSISEMRSLLNSVQTGKLFGEFDKGLTGIRGEAGSLFPGHKSVPEANDIVMRAQTAFGKGFGFQQVLDSATMAIKNLHLPLEKQAMAIELVTKELNGMAGATERAKIGLQKQLSPEAARLQEKYNKEMREGTNPLDVFRHQMKLINEAYDSERNRVEAIKDWANISKEAGNIFGGYGANAQKESDRLNSAYLANMPKTAYEIFNEDYGPPGSNFLEKYKTAKLRELQSKHRENQDELYNFYGRDAKKFGIYGPAGHPDNPKFDPSRYTDVDFNRMYMKDLAELQKKQQAKIEEYVKTHKPNTMLLAGIKGIGEFGAGFLQNTVPWLTSKLYPEVPLTPQQQAEKDFARYKTYEDLKSSLGMKSMADALPTTALYGSAEAQKTINQTQADQQISKLDEIKNVLLLAKEQRERQKTAIDRTNAILEDLKAEGVVLPGGLN